MHFCLAALSRIAYRQSLVAKGHRYSYMADPYKRQTASRHQALALAWRQASGSTAGTASMALTDLLLA